MPSSGASEVSADHTLFQYEDEGRVPLRELGSGSVGPVTVREVSYPSPQGGTVTATMSVPVTEAEDVGVLLLHGMPLDRHDMRTPGVVYACAGATTLAIDAPYVRSGRGSISFTSRDRADQIQLITDLRRGIDLVDQELGPDGAAHVSLVGLSYGGAMGALLAGVDERVASAVLIVGDGGLVAHMTDDDGAPAGPLSSVPEPRSSAWLETMRPIEPLLYVGDSNAAFLFLNGRHDTQVDVADAERLHAAAGGDSEVRWYDTGHDLTAAAYRHQFQWLGEQAGLDSERLAGCVEDHAGLDQFS
jgi:pimeloyl-ACP methyl ester carboxylesterase